MCAALDGRQIASCYAEKSRTPGQTCTSDALCSSGQCNTTVGSCKSITGLACSLEVGCADPATPAARVACSGVHGNSGVTTTTLTCHPVGDAPGLCNYCVDATDCEEGRICYGGLCVGDSGAEFVNVSPCCANGFVCNNGPAVSSCTCK